MEELKKLIEEIGKAFNEYKATNDARIEELKKGGQAGEHEEKLARLEAKLAQLEEAKSALEAKLNRPGNPGNPDPEKEEYRKSFDDWLRKGADGGLSAKTVNTGSDADGGYAVPEIVNMNVYNLLRSAVPMRGVCSVISIGSNNYSQLVGTHGATGGWVGESDARSATNTPKLERVSAVMGEVYANPQATQASLDDMYFDVEGWLGSEIAEEFAIMENAAFTNGNGTNKPKGLFAYPTAATKDGTRPFGTLQFIKSGAAGAFPASPGDLLIDLVTAVKTGHLANARFMFNRLTQAAIRKFKDADGNYLWQPGLQAGVPGLLLGYPVAVNDDMPDIAADSLSVAFGNFAAAYTIVDRIGIRMLRDPYTNKPMVGFYSTKRVGGFLKDSEAVKLLKFSA